MARLLKVAAAQMDPNNEAPSRAERRHPEHHGLATAPGAAASRRPAPGASA